jgi:hypothetical protein
MHLIDLHSSSPLFYWIHPELAHHMNDHQGKVPDKSTHDSQWKTRYKDKIFHPVNKKRLILAVSKAV